MVNLNKFCKREILIQLPGEPREQHLGDVRPKKFELHKFSFTTKNFIKDEMTGRVDILWRIFEKIAKKLKMKSQEQKKVHNSTFFSPVTSVFTFLEVSQKCARLYGPFRSFRHINMKVLISNWLLNSKISQLETLKLLEVLVFSSFFFLFSFSKVQKVKYLPHL